MDAAKIPTTATTIPNARPLEGERPVTTNRIRLLGVLLIAMFTAAACGTRLPDSAFVLESSGGDTPGIVDGAGEAVGPGESITPGDPSGTASGGTGSGSTSGGGATSGGGGGNGGTNGGGGTGGGGGGGTGSERANFASDTGVTATEIVIGNIAAKNGPLGPNTFTPGYYGARAYFEALNAKGGVHGRRIRFVTCDDAENPEKNKSCARDLIEKQKVFALTASATDAQASGEIVWKAGVPDVGGQPIGSDYYKYPTHYSMLGSEGFARDGKTIGENGRVYVQATPALWFKQNLGIKKAAVIYYSTPDIARQAGDLISRQLEAAGIQVVYTPNNGAGRNPADPNFDTDVIGMRNAGAEAVWQAIDIAGFQRLCQSMDRLNYTKDVKAAVGTVQGMGQLVGNFSNPCRNKVYANVESWPFSDTSNPEIVTFQAAMARYNSGVPLHQWALEGWAAAKMITDGIARMGADVTRDGLIEWLDGVRDYDAGGLMAGIDWRRSRIDRSKSKVECVSIAQWQDSAGTFVSRAKPFTCLNSPWIYYTAS